MLSARDYVEIRITRRLNKQLPTDRFVPNDEYSQMVACLEPVMKNAAHFHHIDGFTGEDLEGMFCMLVHKALRRNEYDFTRPPEPFFKANFHNLVRDINRMMENSLKNNLKKDPLDEAVFWNENGLLL